MKKANTPITLFVSILIFLATSMNVAVAETVAVGFLPFPVIGDAEMIALGKSIPAMMAKNLTEDGAKSVTLAAMDSIQSATMRDFQETGIRNGVDYVVWGSIFKAGRTISVDIRLIKTFGDESPTAFSREADGVEMLNSAVNQISKELAGEIFKRKLIADIRFSGNRRIESDAILRKIETKIGDVYDPESLTQDLKRIYKMGYFDDVRVEKEVKDRGVDIAFVLTEKPSVRQIRFKGNRVLEDSEITEVLKTGSGSILNVYTLEEDLTRIRNLYTGKNYHKCTISYDIQSLENNQADIQFTINEGKKLKIESISFVGNKYFTAKKIKKVMKTNEKGWLSWLTSSGELDENELSQDSKRIESYYKNNGFVDARVSDPEVTYLEDSIAIKFKIDEGSQYTVGSVTFKGDMILPENELREKIKIKESAIYSRETLREDMLALTDVYADKGYANADIVPSIARDTDKLKVDVTYLIKQGSPVYFERIMISGNTKTRDKVIRRQLKVYEQELYSLSGIQTSLSNLRRLDYFEGVDVKTSKGSRDDTMDIRFDIKEKATGAFSIGGGYSSEDSIFGMFAVEERNLFGRGQTLAFKAEVSATSNRYTISFTEPWLFDIPLSAGFDLYNWDKEYDYYDKETKGGALRLGYMIFDYTSVGIKYSYEDFTISNVQEEFTDVDAGQYIVSGITTSLGYDSRNAYFNPTRGTTANISVEYASSALGGEIDFIKYLAEAGQYFPLFWKLTGFLHTRAGFLDDQTSDGIDIDFERFYLGGINSVRGYKSTDINTGTDDNEKKRGGEKFVQFNAEMIFPIVESANVMGVMFYDMGDVYTTDEPISLQDLYTSWGGGIRWYSPMGPIRIEYGMVLNGNEYKTGKGRWEFSMGSTF
ncbi:MAG: outer membrane protein assembly factor BamA [Pseudomonadota bacterium]